MVRDEGWLAILSRMGREDLTEKGIFESRPAGSRQRALGISCLEKSIVGGGNG